MMLHALSSILAEATTPAAQNPLGLGGSFVPIVLMFVMMYFLLIRPQRQKQKALEKLINSVKVGDHVIMNGGEHGIITSVKDRTVMVKVADNMKIEYERSAIGSVSKKSDVIEATAA